MKRLFRQWLLDLLRNDYEVKLEITRTAAPETAHAIETRGKNFPPPPEWWRHPGWLKNAPK